jgi:Type I phosphodiesterase / nucleotide pyrophosphatase
MKKSIAFFIVLFSFSVAFAQRKTEHVIVVTMDGMRWQEVFGGADSVLISDSLYVHDRKELKEKFWNDTLTKRRNELFPFFWNTIAAQGQLYGNRWIGNKVDVSNRYRFSYPGYNEIFTGYPDTAVNSNDKIWNKNKNVLEYINQQQSYKGKVAAFATWDVFPYILNKQRSGLYVNADFDSLRFNSPTFKLLNDLQTLTTRPIGVRPDVITYLAAREYLKTYTPDVLYIAFDETDDFAHGGLYDQYLMSAHAEDGMLADLWKTVQSLPQYRNKTTLIVTCDHGRGDSVKAQWRDHGEAIPEASNIWIAAIGPDTQHTGEQRTNTQLYQRQLAPTIAALLGLNFTPAHEPVTPIKAIYK